MSNTNANKIFDIFVRGNQNKTYTITVWPSTTVLEMKIFFHIKSGDPLENMRLFYHGRQLTDTITVEQIGIKKGEDLYALNRLLGGGEDRLTPFGCTGSNDPTTFDF